MNSTFQPITKQEVQDALGFALLLAQAVRGAGRTGIPAGHLYAACAGKCELPYFEKCVGFLKRQGIVTEENHVLRASSLIA